jgi:hypothetical protein
MHRLVLFARRPRRGRIKTRLVPSLDADRVLLLYHAFLEDQLRFLRRFERSCDLELCLDGAWRPADRALLRGVRTTLQGPGDLGARLGRCFRRGARAGAESVVVIGSDSPTLPARHVRRAFAAMERGIPLVLGPATDGGYVLIGARTPCPELFRDVPWGSPDVLRVTLQRALESGLRPRRLAGWYDVDDAAGLARLVRELRRPAARRRAAATARVLSRWAVAHAPRQRRQASLDPARRPVV